MYHLDVYFSLARVLSPPIQGWQKEEFEKAKDAYQKASRRGEQAHHLNGGKRGV